MTIEKTTNEGSIFRNILSKASIDLIRQTQDEMNNIFLMDDRSIGFLLIELARGARKEDPERLGKPADSYANAFVWSVIPALALRLGVPSFVLSKDERTQIEELPEDSGKLREHIANYLRNTQLVNRPEMLEKEIIHLLDNEFVNGNPIAVALDRLAPAGPDNHDWIAEHTREISRARFGDERFSNWTPEMQDYGEKQDSPVENSESPSEASDDHALEMS